MSAGLSLPNPADQRAASAPVQPVVGQSKFNEERKWRATYASYLALRVAHATHRCKVCDTAAMGDQIEPIGLTAEIEEQHTLITRLSNLLQGTYPMKFLRISALLFPLLLCNAAEQLSASRVNQLLKAILKVETRSTVSTSGAIEYLDRSVGASGEYGPYQMTEAAYRQVYKGGRPRSDIKTDMQFATDVARLYILWLDKHYSKGDWVKTIQYYNAGPRNKSIGYLSKIKATMLCDWL